MLTTRFVKRGNTIRIIGSAQFPYHRLLKTLLTTTVFQRESIQSQLARLEQKLHKIKRHESS
ncbi:MAG: hypothetical protein P0119_21140 [Nitrospira sp.]|nr:hypothetical protein [Nitrospira sp.]